MRQGCWREVVRVQPDDFMGEHKGGLMCRMVGNIIHSDLNTSSCDVTTCIFKVHYLQGVLPNLELWSAAVCV
jgi:hypothetical protein